ncbi:MAG: rod shape-determining protein [Pseudonocardia sp.]
MIEFGIDLGTANTVVCDTGGAVLLDEPSVILVRSDGRRRVLAATGRSAVDLVGRTTPSLQPVRPLHDGAITDLETSRLYLRSLIARSTPGPWWRRRRVRAVIGVPVGATALERRALLEAADEAGITRAATVVEPIAGAIGCGIDPMQHRARMVVDVGGGTAEVTAFCFGGLLAQGSSRVAGDEMTAAVAHYLREEHQVLVGELDAEQVKIRAGLTTDPTVLVQGRDAGTGRARQVSVPVAEVTAALQPVIASIINALSGCLDELSPQATGDVLAEGIVLFGGGSLAGGFAESLEHAFGFPVKRADNPLTCVAQGAVVCLRHPELILGYGQQL